jgi:beta-N-acetylhexosaminidase
VGVCIVSVALAAGCGGTHQTAATIRHGRPAHTRSAGTASTVSVTMTGRTAPPAVTSQANTRPAATAATLSANRSDVPPAVKPPIVWDPIPFGPERKAQMAAYAERHYGIDSYRLIRPHVIVIHYTETPDFQSTYNTFAPDIPDPELHELPNVCAHFVIDQFGVIHQLVALGIMCRHTVGLNWTAIGIEHVGYSDQQVLGNPRQMAASLELVRWLRCRYRIPIADVIGHNESLTSPYHHENVPALRAQTHADFNRPDMQIYRSRLRALGSCPTRLACECRWG